MGVRKALSTGPAVSPPNSTAGDARVIGWQFLIGLISVLMTYLTDFGTEYITEEHLGIYTPLVSAAYYFGIDFVRRWLADNSSTNNHPPSTLNGRYPP